MLLVLLLILVVASMIHLCDRRLHNNNPVVLLVVFDVYVIVGCPCRRLSLSSSLENIVRDGNKDVWSQVATTTLKMMT